MTLHVLPAAVSHAYSLVGDIRKEDNEEWVAASGQRTLPMLIRCIELNPEMSRAIICDHSAACLLIYGATPSPDPGVGLAWLVATNAAYRQVHAIHHFFKRGLNELHDHYPVLDAWAYHRNTVHHEWMLRLGFEKTGDRVQLGMGFDFLKFTRSAV